MFILEKDKLKKTESESVSPQKVETTVETTV